MPSSAPRLPRPNRRHRPAVGEQKVMARGQGRRPVGETGRVLADLVRLQARAPRLVLRDPVAHAVAEPGRHRVRILDKGLGRLPPGPAALVLQPLRQVPVEEGRVGDDAGVEQAVHEPAVEIEAARVHAPAARREHARPRDREAVRLEPEVPHERDVLAPPVVMVAGHVAGGAARDLSRRAGETVPDRLAAPVGVRRAFDLIGEGGRAPNEAGGKRRAAVGAVRVQPSSSFPLEAG